MRRHRPGLTLLLGALLLPLAPAAGPPVVEVVSPPAHAVVPARPFYVICKGGPADLTVDGRQQPWDAFAAPLQVARLRLEPGRHDLRIGGQSVPVWVEGNPPPAGWTAHLHGIAPGDDACGRCHQTSLRDGRIAVSGVGSFAACLECHGSTQLEARHSHPLEPLKHCGSCHAPHSSPLKGLLKAPAKKLCAECHES